MKLVHGGRGAGKTSWVMHWLMQDPQNRYVLCSFDTSANFLRDALLREIVKAWPSAYTQPMPRVHGWARQHVLTAQPNVLRGLPPDIEVAVDNLDWVIERLLGVDRIAVGTMVIHETANELVDLVPGDQAGVRHEGWVQP